jgi:hypothetical protein
LIELLDINVYQSEREHRTSKGRFLRTSGREIPQQLSKIEQRQRAISQISESLNASPPRIEPEDVAVNPGIHYTIGKSQKSPVHIPTFLQRHKGDPAVMASGFSSDSTRTPLIVLAQDFSPKLRDHLLPRIQAALQKEAAHRPNVNSVPHASSPSLDSATSNGVFFKGESMYQHKLLRFNFTTYDMRRETDIINPGTSRRDIMLLADHADGSDPPNLHHFLYARILGAFHANVIYPGPGPPDYKARRFDFLWVRWFEVVDPGSSGWKHSTLDSLRFPPLHRSDSFGFVDPDDVLRGCHILPAFAKGKRIETKVDVSRCAKDSKDYLLYYVNRWVSAYLYGA